MAISRLAFIPHVSHPYRCWAVLSALVCFTGPGLDPLSREEHMGHSDLTREQLDRLHATLFPAVNLLNQLERRMTRLGFLADDPLYLAVVKAQSAAQELYIQVHYLGCSSGVGRPRRGGRDGGSRSAD